MTKPKPKPPRPETFFRKLRRLDLPDRTKTLLKELWRTARGIAARLVGFLYKRREFCTSLLLGVCLYYFIAPLAYVGPLLASLSLSLSILHGVIRQFEADMNRHFTVLVPQPT